MPNAQYFLLSSYTTRILHVAITHFVLHILPPFRFLSVSPLVCSFAFKPRHNHLSFSTGEFLQELLFLLSLFLPQRACPPSSSTYSFQASLLPTTSPPYTPSSPPLSPLSPSPPPSCPSPRSQNCNLAFIACRPQQQRFPQNKISWSQGGLASSFLAASFLAASFLAASFLAASFLAANFLAASFLAASFQNSC